MTFKTLTGTCHCKKVHYTLTLPPNALPLPVHLCSCSICRHVHGTLASFHAPLPAGIAPQFIPPSSLDALTSYSHANAESARLFCSTCGCHIGDHDPSENTWYISISLFQPNDKNNPWYEIRSHTFTHSTRDGGFPNILPRINDKPIPIWNPECSVPELPVLLEENPGNQGTSEDLLAECHCGGVSFRIARPREEYLASPASRGWVHPSDKTKWLMSLDPCNSCRLVTGANVVAWMFVAVDHVSPVLPADRLIGTSKGYASSEGVWRTFCGTCGATIFYTADERSQVVDVAAGILRAPGGVMAEDWGVWRTSRVGFVEDGLEYDETFMTGLVDGLREWGVRQKGAVTEFVVGAETHNPA